MTSLGGVLRGTAELPIPVRTSTNSCVIDDLIIFTESEYDYAEGDYNYIYTDGIYDDYYEEDEENAKVDQSKGKNSSSKGEDDLQPKEKRFCSEAMKSVSEFFQQPQFIIINVNN